jgi:EAL domain-containing protein (putative c-di-GMP-specific phosphodiesterase class I)
VIAPGPSASSTVSGTPASGSPVDDYGTGYSSLAYLRELPVDELKLDKSFLANLQEDPRALAIVRSTIRLAQSLGLRMVAEGVEDEATSEELVRAGCEVHQGGSTPRRSPRTISRRGWTGRTSPACPRSAGTARPPR